MATETYPVRPEVSSRRLARELALALGAGQLGGLTMAALLVLAFALFLGHSPLFPVQLIGSLFLGASHVHDAFDAPAFLVGLAAHQLGPALFWSLIFSAVVSGAGRPFTLGSLLLLGFALGGVAELVDVYWVMPAFQRAVNGANLWARYMPRPWDWAAHLAYGLAMGFFYFVLREAVLSPGEQVLPRS